MNDFSDLVNENDGLEILVSRENILMDSMKFFDQHWPDFPARLYVCSSLLLQYMYICNRYHLMVS